MEQFTAEINSETVSGELIIRIDSDATLEGNQTLIATIDSVSPPIDIGPIASTTITIQDEDGVFFIKCMLLHTFDVYIK